ncbi:MAG TPA: hypothetical protein VFG29_02665 [Syntrophales bacterium]|nr:hypothetical protein [Syntrophales bacterium]
MQFHCRIIRKVPEAICQFVYDFFVDCIDFPPAQCIAGKPSFTVKPVKSMVTLPYAYFLQTYADIYSASVKEARYLA